MRKFLLFAPPSFCAVLLFAHFNSFAFKCDLQSVNKQNVVVDGCSDDVSWNYGLDSIREKNPEEFNRIVTEDVTKNTNFGVTRVVFGKNKVKEIYRSSFTNKVQSCITNLVSKKNVTTVINLYSGEISNNVQLAQEELTLFQKAGAKQYLRVLNYDYRMNTVAAQKVLYDKVREVIQLVKSAPDNVLMHCYGGQHRTGIVFGVIQKCLNKKPIEQVIAEYRCHTAYENEQRRGGAKEENEKAIREFPCNSL